MHYNYKRKSVLTYTILTAFFVLFSCNKEQGEKNILISIELTADKQQFIENGKYKLLFFVKVSEQQIR